MKTDKQLRQIHTNAQLNRGEPTRLAESLPVIPAKRPDYEELVRQLDANRAQSKALEIDLRLRAAFVPVRHMRCPVNQSAEWDVKFQSVKAILNTGFLVAVLGDRGTGKTQLAVELMRKFAQDSGLLLYVWAVEIFMAIKEAFHKDGPSERQQIDRFVRPDLLVIDEAHERGETEWENRMFSHLIDRRYAAMKDTLLLSNSTSDEFKASVGPSIYSRLIETGGIIECNWESFRKASTA